MHREPECQVERAYPDKLVFGKCIPNKKRLCMKHWPYGPSNMEDWRTFRAMNECNPDRLYANFRSAQLSRDEWKGTKEERIKLWIEERAKLVNARQIEFDDIVIKGNRKPIRKKTRSSFRKRLLAHLRRKES